MSFREKFEISQKMIDHTTRQLKKFKCEHFRLSSFLYFSLKLFEYKEIFFSVLFFIKTNPIWSEKINK